jgi:hypothetical protein
MVEPEKNPGGIPVDGDGNAAPAVADVAMTVGNERSGSLCLRQVLIAPARGAVPDTCSGQIRVESQS